MSKTKTTVGCNPFGCVTLLARVGVVVSRLWPEFAAAQGIADPWHAEVTENGRLVTWGLPAIEAHRTPYFLALESLSRRLEDDGWSIERGTRDGRPTWRVVGLVSEEERTPSTSAYRIREARLRHDRQVRDMGRPEGLQPNREAEKIRNNRRSWDRAYGRGGQGT